MPSTHYRKIKDGRQAYHHPPVRLPDPEPGTRAFPRWLWIIAAVVAAALGAVALLQ